MTQVRKDIPEYLSISFENHVSTNRDLHLRLWGGQLRMLERPSAADLSATRAVGRLRASQGVPLEALIGAYQVTHKEIWDVLRTRVPPTSGLLGEITTFLLSRLQLVIEAVSIGYRAGQSIQGTTTLSLQRRLVGAMLGGATGTDVAELSEDLGMVPTEDFVGAWLHTDVAPERMLSAVLRSVRDLPAAVCVVGPDVVVVVQRASASQLGAQLDLLPGRIGIGLARPGLVGARTSLGDAKRAAELAEPGAGVQLFEDNWMWACVHAEKERLAPVLAHPALVAREHPDLAETVRAFSNSGFSISRTAQKLNVHPNTAAYRIDRWKKLSGLDLRSGRGLAASLIVVDTVIASESRLANTLPS
ncbi:MULTISPECIES: CdaR family transcriptional regulator [unclassified Pseudofrankia]|uniref:PucR family transcriptional regulator n=1 Tax=unclassified Pseudofrankia TaxID=2994372 RepID=UPI00104233ED|nr:MULTISPECIES: PucR family transcriptional regulator [unclassified Pseudofrankia]MDT3440739.1 helix-turn-helix domain-containing protein [Pseudofrankia sp. BMG5.37]